MSSMEPPVDWRNPGRPGDDPDGLLRAYFRAELPDPWPEFRRPRDRSGSEAVPLRARPSLKEAAANQSRTRFRSQLALAASVGLLLLGTVVLSGQFHSRTPETPYGTPNANRRAVPDMIMKESLLQEVEVRPGPDGRPMRQDKPTKYLIEFYKP